ncbi:MAG TPA: hypothetical protein VKA31_04025 [Mariprofundaceae bacterium]|nr:hypothetical protein [Mariprofundaceae bacterium]
MTPLEIAAKAYYEAVIGTAVRWDDLHTWEQKRVCSEMRAALLALAECDLPDDLVTHALKISASRFPEGHFVGVREGYRIEFRAMLRAIATEQNDV